MTGQHDKPSTSDFKTFWSVFEAEQQRRREQLQKEHDTNGETETRHRLPEAEAPRTGSRTARTQKNQRVSPVDQTDNQEQK